MLDEELFAERLGRLKEVGRSDVADELRDLHEGGYSIVTSSNHCLSDWILDAICWEYTPQGYAYWERVYEDLEVLEQ